MSTHTNRMSSRSLQIAEHISNRPPREQNAARGYKQDTPDFLRQQRVVYKHELNRYYKCQSYGTHRIYEWKRISVSEVVICMKDRNDTIIMTVRNFLDVFNIGYK